MRTRLVISLLALLVVTPVISQQVNSLYFIENTPQRNSLNPAFHSYDKWYISMPVLGGFGFSVGNNSLTFKDVVFKSGNSTITFLNNQNTVDKFYRTLQNTTNITFEKEINLIGFGEKSDYSFWNFSLSQKTEGTFALSKNIFSLLLYGTNNSNGNYLNLSKTGADISDYFETAFGYSQQLTDKLTVGAKAKLLFGLQNLSVVNKGIYLNADIEKLELKADVSYRTSGNISEAITDGYYQNLINFGKLNGLGVAFDLGFEYRMTDHFVISAAVTDLGFISWFGNTNRVDLKTAYQFNGIATIDFNVNSAILTQQLNNLSSYQFLSDSLLDVLNNSGTLTEKSNIPYSTITKARLNIGMEYMLPDQPFSVGIVSSMGIYNRYLDEEITASLNYRPYKWLNAATSYSVLKGRSSFGAALGVKLGLINVFAAADYIPLLKKNIDIATLGADTKDFTIPVPYHSMYFNLRSGVNIVFNNLYPKEYKNRHNCNCDWY